MLDLSQLIKSGAAVQRHIDAPLYPERLRYLRHLHEQGATFLTLRQYTWRLLAIAQWLRTQPAEPLTRARTTAAASRWSRQPGARHARNWRGRQNYIRIAMEWFTFLGWLEIKSAEDPHNVELEAFMHHQREECGLSEATLRLRRCAAADFLRWIQTQHVELARIEATTVDRWLKHKARQGWGRVTIHNGASHLRVFLRFCEDRRLISPNIARGIVIGRVYKTESIPMGPPWETVKQILTQKHGSRACNIRDRAILSLFAFYGLRSAEVQRLRLEDIDWQHSLIHVHRSKHRPRVETYPLIDTVRDALVEYLSEVRPKSNHRRIFLHLRMPYGPLGGTAYCYVVRRRLKRLNVGLKYHGPHALRHACATRLLERGFGLKPIGDFLGHRYTASTCTYAKVDVAALKTVADFDLGRFL